jgi:hypothetical protein
MKSRLFYIIITPQSLRYLQFALWSLQKRNDFEACLVANGLNTIEYNDLIDFSNKIQCQYKRLQTTNVLPHGIALNMLIDQHKESWFCFCDSDIISTDQNTNDIPLDKDFKALSSCDAMFWDDAPVKGVMGRCNRWPDGSHNLSSFFCMYHTQTTKSLINKYKVGFENIGVKNIQSIDLQSILKKKGITILNRKLDTGKALTAAFELEKQDYKHVEIPTLLHIGGLSSWMLNGNKELVHAEYSLSDQDLYQIAQEQSWLYNAKALKDSKNALFYLRRQQRLSAARYCFQLISSYVDNTPRPSHSLSDSDFVLKIDEIETTIKQYFKEFS